MPTVSTQTSVVDRRRTPGASNVESSQPVRSGGYGALHVKKAAPTPSEIHHEEEENGDEDEEGSSESGSSEESSVVRFSDLTGREWVTVGMLAIANLCSTIAFSCIAPFYPAEAQIKGLNTSEIGVIFGAFELVCSITCCLCSYLSFQIMFIAAPFLGKYVNFQALIDGEKYRLIF